MSAAQHVGPGQHACSAVRSPQTQGGSPPDNDFEFRPETVQIQAPTFRIFAAVSVTRVGQRAFNGASRAVGRSSRPHECHVVLKSNPRDPSRGHRVRLGEGKL